MKTTVQFSKAKRLGCGVALLVATGLSACVTPADSEARAAEFRACLDQARITGSYSTQYVYTSGGQSKTVIASETVTQAQADSANACLLEKGY